MTVEILQTTLEGSVERRTQLVEGFREMAKKAGTKNSRGETVKHGGEQLRQHRSPVVGQISVRTTDPERTRKFYEEIMGMKLLCVEKVKKHNMDLHFFGYLPSGAGPDDLPPSSDVFALENREWCYQRRYTTLEFHFQYNMAGKKLRPDFDSSKGQAGLRYVSFSITDAGVMRNVKAHETWNENSKTLKDPDGLEIRVYDCVPGPKPGRGAKQAEPSKADEVPRPRATWSKVQTYSHGPIVRYNHDQTFSF